MFTAILIHAGSNRSHMLRYLVASADCVEVQRDFEHTPSEHELTRVLGSMSPEVIIVDLAATEATSLALKVRSIAPSTAIIGFGPSLETAVVAPKVGFDALLDTNASTEDMREAIQDTLRKNFGGIEKSLFCFIPSKAGSGCSTVVLNTAAALVRNEGKRVLVLDADLRSGVLAILLGAEPTRSIQSVLAGINQIDRNRFPDCIYSSQGVDYLLSSRALDAAPPDWSDYFHLIAMAKPLYDAILVDLPELVNPASFELVRRSQRTFVVCTPEIPSMTLARHRCEELSRLKIEQERVGLLVNRWHRSDPSPEEIGNLVHHDVTSVFPNDYPVVRAAIVSGRPVSEKSRLGQAFGDFAVELIGKQAIKTNSIAGKLKSLWGIRETTHAG